MSKAASCAGSPEELAGAGPKEEMGTAEGTKTAAETVQNTWRQSWPGSEGRRQSTLPAPPMFLGGSPTLFCLCSPPESDSPL